MTILLLTDELSANGTARQVVDLANGLVERGAEAIVAGADGPYRKLLRKNVRFLELPLFVRGSSQKSVLGFIRSTASLLKAIIKFKVQIVHSHKRYSDILGRTVARFTGTKHLSTCHNVFSDWKMFSVFGDFTIACSEEMRRSLIDTFGKAADTVETVYSGLRPLKRLSPDECRSVYIRLGIDPGRRVIASIGHFTPAKDRLTLVRAISQIKKTIRELSACLAIVGEGPQEESAHKLIGEFKISDIVRCYPANADVEGIINIAEFLILSSTREGLPYVLLEAASLAKAHIATRVGGVPEFVIDRSTGILVPPHDPEQLGAAVEELLRDPAKAERLGMEAGKHFTSYHSYEAFVMKTISIYERLLTR
jgi:glycosyltransferase involved in cell wall biosynthesis